MAKINMILPKMLLCLQTRKAPSDVKFTAGIILCVLSPQIIGDYLGVH